MTTTATAPTIIAYTEDRMILMITEPGAGTYYEGRIRNVDGHMVTRVTYCADLFEATTRVERALEEQASAVDFWNQDLFAGKAA